MRSNQLSYRASFGTPFGNATAKVDKTFHTAQIFSVKYHSQPPLTPPPPGHYRNTCLNLHMSKARPNILCAITHHADHRPYIAMKKVFIKETNSVFVTTKSDLEISNSVFVNKKMKDIS